MPESYEYWVAYGGAVLNWPEASWLRIFVEGVVIVNIVIEQDSIEVRIGKPKALSRVTMT